VTAPLRNWSASATTLSGSARSPRDDPAGLQAICDRLQPGTIEVFAQRWLHRLPMPFGPADRDAGYWWETSMRQVEVSRTLVFGAPRRARFFFEALIGDNLDVGRRRRRAQLSCKHSRIRQYPKEGRAMRIETVRPWTAEITAAITLLQAIPTG